MASTFLLMLVMAEMNYCSYSRNRFIIIVIPTNYQTAIVAAVIRGNKSIEEHIFEGFEESRWKDLRFEYIGGRLVDVHSVSAAADLIAFVVGDVPVLAAEHLHLYILGLPQSFASLFLVLVRILSVPLYWLLAWLHLLDLDPLFLGATDQSELDMRDGLKG